MSMNRLENVANFTEFVKAFALFGTEMIELAQLTSDKQNVSRLSSLVFHKFLIQLLSIFIYFC